MAEFKLIIFDLGKVVFDVSFERVFVKWAGFSGKPVDLIRENFRFNETYEKFEKADLSQFEFRKEIMEMIGISISEKDFDLAWTDLYLDVYPGMNELLKKLSIQYKLVALTNTNSIHATVWKQKYKETLKYFDKVFSSHEMRRRKPEKEAYEKVLDHFGVEASESIFLDDNADNVAAALNCGISAIHVLSPEQMIRDLYSRLNTSKNA